jgi:sugar lactone lactonase YvrE
MRLLLAALICILVPLSTAAAVPIQVSDPIGFYGAGFVQHPTGIAFAANGDVFVVSRDADRVDKFSAAGTHLLGWGGTGNGPGQFQVPYAVALGPAGEVYVSDIVSDRIQRFSAGGSYLGEFGGPGNGNGQFDQPHGLAFDAAGNLYVADTYNHRVQKFSPTGTWLAQWGGLGTGPGEFNLPYGIAIDGRGDVYVADTYNHRVQKFSASGVFERQWGVLGTGDGEFEFPVGVHVDPSGNVFVTDVNNHRVQRFTSKGVFVLKWGSEGNGPYGQFEFPQAVAVDARGDIHVADTGNHRIQLYRNRYTSAHEPTGAFGGPGSGNGLFSDIRGIAVSKGGFVYVADKNGCRMQKYSTNGNWLAAWGESGDGDGQFNGPCGVAVDSSGVVYVVDHLNARVEKFLGDGTYAGRWNHPGGFVGAWDIAIDAAQNVWVSDGNRISRFHTDGTYVSEFAAPNVAGIGVDGEGFIYAACTSDHVVRKYAPDGTLVNSWGSFGIDPAKFATPSDVVCDGDNYVYVCDSNGRVQQFTPMGGYVKEWGEAGSDIHGIGAPQMMATDALGNVYVTEFTNSRWHKFAAPPEILSLVDVPGDEGGSVVLTFRRSSAEPLSANGVLSSYRVVRVDEGVPIGVVLANLPGDVASTSVTIATGANATDTWNGIREVHLQAFTVVQGSFAMTTFNYGYSTDDLAPPAAPFFAAVYEGGATHLHWSPSTTGDLKEYRLYRNASPPAAPVGSPIYVSPDTGYVDPSPPGGYYALVTVDTSGNVGESAILGPQQTVDVTPSEGVAFALAPVQPNPARGGTALLRFTLPDAQAARLELLSVAGRSVWSRTVSGAGAHSVRAGEDLAAGIYLVRLTRGGHSLVRRVVVLD